MRIMVLHFKLKQSLAFFASVGLSDCSRYLVGFFVLKLNDEFPLSTESILDHVKCIPETVMSEHDKNLFIEQHNDGYAILRGSVEKPLAVEPTQDAAIDKARKLEPDAASPRYLVTEPWVGYRLEPGE